ncbi:MAG: C10 family peptidase [Bacteroidaceae bacterium]|nr:C10 family peptidase [Bacteroidaceae bacterium]
MRKLNLSFLMLCCSLVGMAEPVGKQTALYTAQSYMMSKGKHINTTQKPFRAARKKASAQTEEEAYYYVFNAGNNGGYVIVSGDDRVAPILGYVEQGSFDPDQIPENMRVWLEGYEEEIKYVIDNDLKPSSPALRRRSRVINTKHSIPEILTTRWNQGLPYNLTVEKYYKEDGSQARPATGCIATAWAQVINFHRYPDQIKVAIPSYTKTYTLKNGTSKTVTFPAVPRGAKIDWDNMQDTYDCNESHAHTAADTAVANLMRYCGQAVKMGYGASSGANWKAPDVIKYFGFDERGHRVGRDECSIDEWQDLIYNEIAAGYPVPFSGSKLSGGHAFVLDGFDGDQLFHVNWGWGGGSNGWFLIGVLNSGDNSGIGAASGSGGYARGQAAVIGLRRPYNDKQDTYLSVDDVAISGTSIRATFKNNNSTTGRYNVGIVKLDDDGGISLVGSKQTISSISSDASQSKTFAINGKLPEGTYKLSPASKLTTSEEWKASYNLRDNYIEAVVDAAGKPTLRIVTPVYNISIDTIMFPGTRIVGKEQEIVVKFRNNADEYYKDVYLFASKTNTKVYTENLARVAVRKGESAEFSFYYTPKDTGTYNLWFCSDKNGNNVIGQGTMEVITEAEATKASLSISYSVINGANNIAYGKQLYAKATIRNNGTSNYNGGVKIQLWKQKVGSSTATSSSSSMYNVEIPRGKSVTVDVFFDNLGSDIIAHLKAMYSNQEGTLNGGGTFDFKCQMSDGVISWKTDGTVTGKANSSSMTTSTNICGVLANCSAKINRMTPNRSNPNVIYAFADGMIVPASLDTCNAVSGKQAKHIRMVNDKPFYTPTSFVADSASFTYTFPEEEKGTGWHALTLPFKADSVYIDSIPVALDDCLKHFWIYEFSAQSLSGEVIFTPATELRAATPYIIAADSTMAGRSIEFRGVDVPFYKSGSDKMVISSPAFQFHGHTFNTAVSNCYVLNEEGTAFQYTTTKSTLTPLTSYFTTNLSEESRPASIVLPDLEQLKALLAEQEDAITPVYTTIQKTGVVYDLKGRKLNSQSKKGLYIVDGKKILNK